MPIITEQTISVLRVFVNEKGSITIMELELSSDDHRNDRCIVVALAEVPGLCRALKLAASQAKKEGNDDAEPDHP